MVCLLEDCDKCHAVPTESAHRFLELGHTITAAHALYTVTILDADNPLKFIALPKSLDAGIIFSAFIGMYHSRKKASILISFKCQ